MVLVAAFAAFSGLFDDRFRLPSSCWNLKRCFPAPMHGMLNRVHLEQAGFAWSHCCMVVSKVLWIESVGSNKPFSSASDRRHTRALMVPLAYLLTAQFFQLQPSTWGSDG